MNKTLWNTTIMENSMEVAQTSPYSHGLWNIQLETVSQSREGRPSETKQYTSHQSQCSREHKGKTASDAQGNITETVCRFFHSKLSLKNKSKIRKLSDENIFRLLAFASLRLSMRVGKDVVWVSPRRKECSETWGQEMGRCRSKSNSHWLCETTHMDH